MTQLSPLTLLLALSSLAVELMPAANANFRDPVMNVYNTTLADDVQLAISGLEALLMFTDLMDPDVFDQTSVGTFTEIAHRVMSGIKAFIRTAENPGSDRLMKARLVRARYREAQAKLDCSHLHIVADVVKEAGWKSLYEDHYSSVLVGGHMLENYITALRADRSRFRDGFMSEVKKNMVSPATITSMIVDTEFTYAENLATMAMRVFRNHRRNVMKFLLAMARVALRGAESIVAYEYLYYGEKSTWRIENEWQLRMQSLAVRIKEVDTQVRDKWHGQMESDVNYVIGKHMGHGSPEIVARMHESLSEKYYWRNWFVMTYKKKRSGLFSRWSPKSDTVWQCGGVYRMNIRGEYNVVVASAVPSASRFSRRHAARLLENMQSEGPSTSDAGVWWNHVSPRFGTSCSTAAFIGAICWGECEVRWSAQWDRLASKKMESKGHRMHIVVFG